MDAYRSFVVHHLIPYFGREPITAITVDMIEAFIEAKRAPGGSVRRQGKGLADVSLRGGLLPLRLILQRAVRMKLLPANPMRDVEWRGQPRQDEHGVDPFTVAELRAILACAHAVDADLATLLRLHAQTGMRQGEVCGLQRQDLDLERGTVHVRRTYSRGRLGPTKTGRTRVVSMLHPMAEATAEWRPGVTAASHTLLTGLRALKVQGVSPDAPVFTNRAGVAWTNIQLQHRWRRVPAKAGVRYRSPEQLRHTFASTLLSRNAPLLYVQQQGGWKSAGVLLRVYARWMPQAEALSAGSANNGFPPPATGTLLSPVLAAKGLSTG